MARVRKVSTPSTWHFFNLETRRLHHVQWEFMIQTLLFFMFTGITALIFSKVEGVTYVDGIYYMVVTILTIGFGDIVPHTAVFKVLTFPFTVVGITLLAIIVTSIVQLLADRARRRKRILKKQLKEKASERKRMHSGYKFKLSPWGKGDLPRLQRSLTLQEELHRLREDDWRRERRSNLARVVSGLTVFLAFWFFGAVIFHFVEVNSLHLKCLTCSLGDMAMPCISVTCALFTPIEMD